MSGQDYERLTLFPAGSRASPLVLPGSEEARTMTVTSGLRCLELYRSSGPLGSLVRMLLGSSTWRSTRCYLTWKISATPARRLLFRLVPSTPRTDATEYVSWAGTDNRAIYFIPTPRAVNIPTSEKAKRTSKSGPGLADYVKMWPTPTVNDAINSSLPKSQIKRKQLVGEIMRAQLYPTPTTGAGMCGGTGNYQKLKELEAAGQITEEERRSMAAGNGGQLNPDWVEWLQGFPIGWTEV